MNSASETRIVTAIPDQKFSELAKKCPPVTLIDIRNGKLTKSSSLDNFIVVCDYDIKEGEPVMAWAVEGVVKKAHVTIYSPDRGKCAPMALEGEAASGAEMAEIVANVMIQSQKVLPMFGRTGEDQPKQYTVRIRRGSLDSQKKAS
jgi:hypothetical protein